MNLIYLTWLLNLILVILIQIPSAYLHAEGISAIEFGHRMEAHTLRVCRMMGWALNNPHFLNQFPEYNNVNINKMLSACTSHDINKRTPVSQVEKQSTETKLTLNKNGRLNKASIRNELAADYGKDKYKMAASDEKLKVMNKTIDDLNYYDKRDGKRILKSLNFTETEEKLFLAMEEASDKTDRYLNCPKFKICPEFGKVMEPGTRWIKDPKTKSMAGFFERKLAGSEYQKITADLSDEKYLKLRQQNPNLTFREIRKEKLKTFFVENGTVIDRVASNGKKTAKALSTTLKVATKPLVLVTPAVMAYDAYDAHANGGSAKDAALASFLAISSKDICESSVCNTPNGMQIFLNLPLNEQTKTRLFDTDLNRVLNLNLPLVQTLRCDRQSIDGKIKITLQVVPEHEYLPKPKFVKIGESLQEPKPIDPDKLRTQEFVFSNGGDILSARSSSTDDIAKLNLTFKNNKPDEIKSEGLRNPEYFDTSVEKFRKRFPTWKRPWFDSKANHRYRDISQLESQATVMGKAIYSCCNDKKCIDFYNNKSEIQATKPPTKNITVGIDSHIQVR